MPRGVLEGVTDFVQAKKGQAYAGIHPEEHGEQDQQQFTHGIPKGVLLTFNARSR